MKLKRICRSGFPATVVGGASPRGVALIITLIMLSIITFMAVTFLVLSQRQRGAVATTTAQFTSRLAADTALERAKVELLAPIIGFTNANRYDLLVSVSFNNTNGFNPALNPLVQNRFTNVNYDFTDPGGGSDPLTQAELQQNIANLFYNPRVPVIVTNHVSGSNENRFYLDLNRNRRYDTNGYLPVFSDSPINRYIGSNGLPTANGNLARWEHFVGDPEWIGILERPSLPHSPSNRFIGRYAFIAIPIGKTLDVNFIHNYAKDTPTKMTVLNVFNGDAFLRNQGVGTWELNLASFLTDLSPNIWPASNHPTLLPTTWYSYRPFDFQANGGYAFADSLEILKYRYGGLFSTLQTGRVSFAENNVDEHTVGPLTTNLNVFTVPTTVGPTDPWSGSDNTNHFFTHQDFFDATKVGNNFPMRLMWAGATNNSHDRYTYYRMLAQLGTDSAPEKNQVNINYVNVDARGESVPDLALDMTHWVPEQFFTNAANRLLREYNLRNPVDTSEYLSVHNIPIYPTNAYTPMVHRLLQVAANVYDATTNRLDYNVINEPYPPTVYRPQFSLSPDRTSVRITNYVEIRNPLETTAFFQSPILDLSDSNQVDQVVPNCRIYNFPIIIGARKGFPNFNEFVSETMVNAVRRLEFRRDSTNAPVTQTNQIYTFDIQNSYGLELWNSYSNAYPRQLSLVSTAETIVTISNEFTQILFADNIRTGKTQVLPPLDWTGYRRTAGEQANRASFRIPYLSDVTFHYSDVPALSNRFEQFAVAGGQFPIPRRWVHTRGRVWAAIVDSGHIVDYVHVSHANESGDLTYKLMEGGRTGGLPDNQSTETGDFWVTNRVNNQVSVAFRTIGIDTQIRAGLGKLVSDEKSWTRDVSYGPTVSDATKFFCVNLYSGMPNNPSADCNATVLDNIKTNLIFYAPYNPSRKVYQNIHFQVNDPLVHYLAEDMINVMHSTNFYAAPDVRTNSNPAALSDLLYLVNDRYLPWGMNSSDTGYTDQSLKDSRVANSDLWRFPTNKFPNVGWLGRVHRGTPWQTIYMKSSNIVANAGAPGDPGFKRWTEWSGYRNIVVATNMAPIADRRMFDVFTASLNENSTRGRLSVNQTNLAAWSAVFGGMYVFTNAFNTNRNGTIIDPVGFYDPSQPTNLWPRLAQLVAGINRTRATTNVFPKRAFTRAGDILATPELSENSPFIAKIPDSFKALANQPDYVYEWIPQQMLSLVTHSDSPRFVVYAYGQSLSPAERSVLTSGPFFGLCTNYQITAESVLRAVIRVEGFDPDDDDDVPRIVVEQFNVLPSE